MAENGNGYRNFVFADFRLENDSQTLLRNDAEIHLAKRPFQVLHFLIENRERVVSRTELLDKFWDGRDVYDDALRKCVGSIRKALHDEEKPPRFIETRYGSGYRFIGKIEEPAITNGNQKLNSLALYSSVNGSEKADAKPAELTLNDNANGVRNSRYVLTSVSLAIVLFFVSVGFYVYFPKGADQASHLVDAAAPVRSIAVLPLKNLTNEPNSEYFSDGVTESIITELSRVNELRIVSRSSTFALKDKEIDPREIGKKLNVDALLEGSVQKKGDLLSVSVRLISTQDGRILWTSQDFERPVANAYELQDTISRSIAIALRAELGDTVSRRNTTNADAYQAYLKGRYYWNKRTGEGIKRSIEFYEQAIRLDSNYALAYAGLAESYVQGIWHVPFATKEALPKAEDAALKALELDDALPEAHTALATVYELKWNWPEAERELQRAIEINPRYARAYHVQAFFFVIMGRNDEAIASIERSMELDPLNMVINTDKAMVLFAANRTEEAFQQWKITSEMDSSFVMAYEHRAQAYQALGNEPAAIEEYTKSMELSGQSPEKIRAYRQTVSKYGLKETYRQELIKLLEKESLGKPVSFLDAAFYYTLLGQKDRAFKYLEKAYRDRDAKMVLLTSFRPFASLRSDPRFSDLLRRVGLPE